LESGGPNILDEVFKNHAELWVAQALGYGFGHGCSVVDLTAHEAELVVLDEFPKIIEALFEVAVVDDTVLSATIIEETLEFCPIFLEITRELRELIFHELIFLIKIDRRPLFEKVAPVGSHGVELHIVFHPFSGSLKEVSKELGEGENRRSEVKGKAVFLE
jgi:hypothetical protein